MLLEKSELVDVLSQRLVEDKRLRLQLMTFCEICCRWLNTEDMWPLTCSHLVCELCLARHLAVEAEKMLSNAKRHPLPCLFPECKTAISVKTASDFCQKVRGVWNDLGARERLLQNAKYPVAECPKSECVGVAYVEPGRRTAMCFLCEHQWQVSEAEDTSAEANYDAGVRNCPKCNAPIEKSWGCNHMQCWKCGRNFDWARANHANRTYDAGGASSGEGAGGDFFFGGGGQQPHHPPECVIS